MLQIDLWKRIAIILTCVVGLFLAMPNLFYTPVERHNDAVQAIELNGATPELEAERALWPEFLPSGLVNLGLDLRGGAHLLAEVRVKEVYKARMDATWQEARDMKLQDASAMPQALAAVRELARPVTSLTGVGTNDIEVSGDGDTITIVMSDAEKQATDERTMQQSLEIIRRRIDAVGTREPTIQRQGAERILIQVPGIGSASELKEKSWSMRSPPLTRTDRLR